tara:strand:- start:1997 stop:3970 length:1974 start_codon:yes stop_codon:yes gene_type:complete
MSPEQWLATQQAQQPQTQSAPVAQPQQPKQQAAMSPEQWAASQQEKPEMGFFESIGEAITGSRRTTEESKTLPEWTGMPELNQMSMASFKSALGTLVSNPVETVQIMKANFPDLQIRQDPKGNYIMKSSIDQKEYVIPPGVSMGDIPRILGGVLSFTPAGRATTLPKMAIGSAATQAAIETSQAATGGEFNPEEVVIAGAAAPIVPGIARIPSAISALTKPIQEPIKGTLEAAKQVGVRVLTSDVLRPQTFIGKTGQQIGERIPIAGTGPVRAAQQTERMDAVKNLFSQYGVTGSENLSDDIIQDVVKKRSGVVTKYASMKNDVFNRLDAAGTVPVNKTVQQIDDEMIRLGDVTGADPLINRLQELKGKLQNNPNIKAVESNRKVIGDWLKDDSIASIKTETQKVAKRLYGPLQDDMSDFISANGQQRDLVKWKIANKNLADSIGDLEKTAFKAAIDKADVTPELVMNMLLSKKPSDSALLYKSLSDEGRKNAKAAIINQVAAKASVADATAPGGKVFSPEAFAREVDRLEPTVKNFFRGDELKQLQGLSRAITLTQRAAQAGVSPSTGAQLAPLVTYGSLAQFFSSQGFGAIGSLLGTATSVGAIGGAARVYESAPVRNIMIKLAQSPRNTPEEAKLLNKLALTVQQMEKEKQPQE